MAAVKGRALNVGWDMHGRFLTAQDIDSFLRDLPAVQYFDDKQNVIVGNSTEDAAAKIRARLAALNEWAFIFRNEFSGSLEWCRLPEKQPAKQKDGFSIRPFRISNTAKCPA